MCNPKSNSHFGNYKLELDHNAQHEQWNRRSFMQMLGLAGTGAMMLGGTNITAASPSPLFEALGNSDSDKILLIVRLKGGNDGLNTIVPIYDYDTYARKRPNIRLKENKLYKLSNDFGVDSSLKSFQSLWGDGKMRVAHGVGYDNYNMSHFEGADTWATADSNPKADIGFFGRYFDREYPDYLVHPPENPPAIQIGSVGDLMFEGVDTNFAFTASDTNQLKNIASSGKMHDVNNLPSCTYGRKLGFVRGLLNSTMKYAGVIHKAHESSRNSVSYGNDTFSKQLSIISRVIKGGLKTKIYFVTIDGFDTHANQLATHKQLMSELSNGLKKFYDDLKSGGHDKRVLTMTISEFGRRIEENGSNGTDHGAASTTMFFGPGLQGHGFVGNHPNINDNDKKGNLKFTTDFRSLYCTVLKDWLCINPYVVDKLFPEGYYNTVDLGFSCNSSKEYSSKEADSVATVNKSSTSTDNFTGQTISTTTTELTYENGFFHTPTYQGGNTYIEYNLSDNAKIDIQLYNMVGQKVSNLVNEVKSQGYHKLDIKAHLRGNISPGEYLYTLQTGGQRYSKLILIN